MQREKIADNVFTLKELHDTKWTFYNLVERLMTGEIELAASLGLIRNSKVCEDCKFIPMGIYKDSSRRDGYMWRCKVCNSKSTLREGSFLLGSKLEIRKIVILLYYWSLEMKQTTIQQEIEVAEHTIVDWMQCVREVCEQDILNHPIMLGGINEDNTPKEVEIDESYFFKKTFKRGQITGDKWVFGAVERGSNQFNSNWNLTVVNCRNRDSLFPIIKGWIRPGTRIISDGWAAYGGLDQFEHGISRHNTVMIREEKTRKEMFTLPWLEFVWRRRKPGQVFPRIIECIQEQYPFKDYV